MEDYSIKDMEDDKKTSIIKQESKVLKKNTIGSENEIITKRL